MITDPLALLSEVEQATARLLHTARQLSDADIAAPSALPNWTIGHVLTHVARSGDGHRNLLYWAATGIETPPYPSWEARAAGIEAGAGRPAAEQVADLEQSAAAFAAAARELKPEAWSVIVRWRERDRPAIEVIWSRLREVEVHHVDLGLAYRPADWPDSFSHRLLHEVCDDLSRTEVASPFVVHATDLGHELTVGDPTGRSGIPTVSGPAYLLAAWLTGRADGAGLQVEPEGPLPTVPDWL